MFTQVGDPQLVVKLANELMSKHSVYLQPINYPTVPRGHELLRIAPTPHHTVHMINRLVDAARRVWIDNGLELRPVPHGFVTTGRQGAACRDGNRCSDYAVTNNATVAA